MTGFGLWLQDTCRTNGKGPEIYATCAPGSIIGNRRVRHYKETIRGTKEWIHNYGFSYGACKSGSAPTKLDPPCHGYNIQNKHNEEVLILIRFIVWFSQE